MFVVINGRFLTQKLTGVQRFACELVKALDALIGKGIIDPKYSLLLITPSGIEIPFKLFHIRVKQVGLFAGHLGPCKRLACTYRIALGPRAGQKVLSLQTVPTREPPLTLVRCVDEQGFSLLLRRPSEEETRKPGTDAM